MRFHRSAALAIALATTVAAAPSSSPTPAPSGLGVFDDEEAECSGLVFAGLVTNPMDIDANPLDDEVVKLRIRVLLQGNVDAGTAKRLLAPAMELYERHGLPLRISFGRMGGSPTGDVDANELIAATRAAVGGATPPGVDAVLTLTTKNLTSGALGSSVAGKVDCVGGYADPTRSFGVGEVHLDDLPDMENPNHIGFVNPAKTSIIFAHELFHLFGAHHHFANCAESNVASADAVLGICSLMINDIGLASFETSTANDRIARGHVANYRDRH